VFVRAISISAVGSPDQLKVAEFPSLVSSNNPGEEILIRVEMAGINFFDIYQRRGERPMDFPGVLGVEGIGVILESSLPLQNFRVGDRVGWAGGSRSYSELVTLSEEQLIPLPANIVPEKLLPLLLQGLTAHFLATSSHVASTKTTALVTAASGGVGSVLIQLLQRAGARVIPVTSSDAKVEKLRQLGFEHSCTYTQMKEQVKSLTKGLGVNVVYDSVGKDTFNQTIELVARRGDMVLYGAASGPVEPVNPLSLTRNSIYLSRPTLSDFIPTFAEKKERINDLVSAFLSGALELPPIQIFTFEQAAQAHRLLESGMAGGKLAFRTE
jgi:NADPH2:quinone reductase